MSDVTGWSTETQASSWSIYNPAHRSMGQRPFHPEGQFSSGKVSSRHLKRQSMSSNQSRSRHYRPRSIQVPTQDLLFEDAPLSTPALQTGSGKGSFPESIMTPIDSPEGMYTNFWTAREGSVISSTSSSDSRDAITTFRRQGRLEHPFIGRPKDSRERCMSVSLVVGPDGIAQVRKEEVEVEFLENQRELGVSPAAIMKRMVSNAGSDASVSRHFDNMSFVNSTRGEVLIRSASQRRDLPQSLPLTPNLSENVRFVSPQHLKKSIRPHLQRSVSTSVLHTPESRQWHDSDAGSDDEENENEANLSRSLHDDAQAAVQKLFDRKKGNIAYGFMGSTMPTSPLARPHRSQNTLTCSACQIVFRSPLALANHTSSCSVKQTPFASADFFETPDIFGMSGDFMFMPDLTEEAPRIPLSPLVFGGLLDSAFCDEEPALEMMSPRKRSRFDRLPSLSPTPGPAQLPARAQSTLIESSMKRKR